MYFSFKDVATRATSAHYFYNIIQAQHGFQVLKNI